MKRAWQLATVSETSSKPHELIAYQVGSMFFGESSLSLLSNQE